MIKKNDETGRGNGVVSSFKRFSDMSKTTKGKSEGSDPMELLPDGDEKLPANPNLPVRNTSRPKVADTRYLKPQPQEADYDNDDNDSMNDDEQGIISGSTITEDNNVEFFGKVAKFPKKTKASKAFNFLENVKISKNSIWYIMVEKQQDKELQMVKYNYKKGVDLSKFVVDLKSYYVKKYSSNQKIVKLIENIEVDGNDRYSMIKNIPLIEVDGKKMISKITEDLIKLLSK